jgi:hypothetical protein
MSFFIVRILLTLRLSSHELLGRLLRSCVKSGVATLSTKGSEWVYGLRLLLLHWLLLELRLSSILLLSLRLLLLSHSELSKWIDSLGLGLSLCWRLVEIEVHAGLEGLLLGLLRLILSLGLGSSGVEVVKSGHRISLLRSRGVGDLG